MDYAEVCVNSPAARRQTFSYSIPSHLEIVPGQAVLVPFGARILQGIVIRLAEQPAVEQTKDIAGIVDSKPLLSPQQIELAIWMSDYYLAPLFDSAALFLPPGFERKVLTLVHPVLLSADFDTASLGEEQKRVLDEVQRQNKPVSTAYFERLLGKRKAKRLINQLVNQRLLVKSYEFEPVKVKVKTEFFYVLAVAVEQARQEAGILSGKSTKQAAVLALLAETGIPAAISIIREKTGAGKATADALVKKGLLKSTLEQVKRNPLSRLKTNLSWPLPLTSDQAAALGEIKANLEAALAGNGKGKVFLLHGITGSGKTEVYLQALAAAVQSGKKGIVLVPEIALTPQTLERFTARFPGKVAVIHSGLTLGEQFDEWNRIRNGEADVVIGPRSALFAPQPDLGLIVIDEEHEWSYKQTEKSPYYHTRTAALKLAAISGIPVILGSATPDVESYFHAVKGDYTLLELPERLVPGAAAGGMVQPKTVNELPVIHVIDMREELKAGNRSLFSTGLLQAMTHALNEDGQVILFLNRRGASTFLQCRHCGYTFCCRRCAVSMTYHASEDVLICHQCNSRAPRPQVCPRCRSRDIKFLGLGTEKLELETALTFPGKRLLRWDSDTTRGWQDHIEILDKFRRHEADILIGTQMVGKGLDMPGVTLVGVINADTGLNIPDFRAGERTFQLLSQVAGRAGRGPKGGKVVIQTYSPGHYAVTAAEHYDYKKFYDEEIRYRRQLHQPPFTRLAVLICIEGNDDKCRIESERMRDCLVNLKQAEGISAIEIVGPAPAFIHRRRGLYRWQLVVRGSDPAAFLSKIEPGRNWSIIIDPIGLN